MPTRIILWTARTMRAAGRRLILAGDKLEGWLARRVIPATRRDVSFEQMEGRTHRIAWTNPRNTWSRDPDAVVHKRE